MKVGEQDNKPPLTAEQQKKADAVTAFQKQWNDVKDRVYEGKLTPEELKTTTEALFKHRLAAGPDANKAVQVIVADCKAANISNDNLHKFVGAAIAAEFEFEKTKPSTSGLMRLSSTSVASTLLNYEMDKQGFKPLSLDIVKTGTDKQVIDAYMDVKIPEFIKDHYKPILEYSKQREVEKRSKDDAKNKINDVHEAYTSLVFITVTNPIILENNAKRTELQAELVALPKEKQAAKLAELKEEEKKTDPINTKIAGMSYAAFPSRGDKDSVGNPHPAFAKAGIYEALEKQFDPDKTKQQLSLEKMQELKERAYERDAIQKERRQALDALKPSSPEKNNVPQKEIKAETTSKSLADRLHDVKEKVSHEVGKISEQAAAKASTLSKDIKTTGKDAFKQAETQVRNSAKSVETSVTRLVNNIKEGKLDVNQLKTDLEKTKDAHQFTAEDAKTLGKKLSGKAIEQLGSKGNEVTSKIGKDINTGINTGSISSPVAKRAADIIKDSFAHSAPQPSPKNDPSHDQPLARPTSKPLPKPGQHGGGWNH